MNLEPRHFIFALLIAVMLLVGIPVMVNLAKDKPDYDTDSKTMATLQQAVNTYATQAGHYPTELGALVPGHIAAIPKTAGGKAFLYNYQTGQVSTPYPPPKGMMTVAPTSGKVPAVGDAFTGLSVSNELNF